MPTRRKFIRRKRGADGELNSSASSNTSRRSRTSRTRLDASGIRQTTKTNRKEEKGRGKDNEIAKVKAITTSKINTATINTATINTSTINTAARTATTINTATTTATAINTTLTDPYSGGGGGGGGQEHSSQFDQSRIKKELSEFYDYTTQHHHHDPIMKMAQETKRKFEFDGTGSSSRFHHHYHHHYHHQRSTKNCKSQYYNNNNNSSNNKTHRHYVDQSQQQQQQQQQYRLPSYKNSINIYNYNNNINNTTGLIMNNNINPAKKYNTLEQIVDVEYEFDPVTDDEDDNDSNNIVVDDFSNVQNDENNSSTYGRYRQQRDNNGGLRNGNGYNNNHENESIQLLESLQISDHLSDDFDDDDDDNNYEINNRHIFNEEKMVKNDHDKHSYHALLGNFDHDMMDENLFLKQYRRKKEEQQQQKQLNHQQKQSTNTNGNKNTSKTDIHSNTIFPTDIGIQQQQNSHHQAAVISMSSSSLSSLSPPLTTSLFDKMNLMPPSMDEKSMISYDDLTLSPSISFFLGMNQDELRNEGLSIVGGYNNNSGSISGIGIGGDASRTTTSKKRSKRVNAEDGQQQINEHLKKTFDGTSVTVDDQTRFSFTSSSRHTLDTAKISELRERKRFLERHCLHRIETTLNGGDTGTGRVMSAPAPLPKPPSIIDVSKFKF
jgi:hypothetical protein